MRDQRSVPRGSKACVRAERRVCECGGRAGGRLQLEAAFKTRCNAACVKVSVAVQCDYLPSACNSSHARECRAPLAPAASCGRPHAAQVRPNPANPTQEATRPRATARLKPASAPSPALATERAAPSCDAICGNFCHRRSTPRNGRRASFHGPSPPSLDCSTCGAS